MTELSRFPAAFVPVVLAISLFVERRSTVSGGREPLLPWFLVTFVVLVAVNSAGLVPERAGSILGSVAGWCLLTAVAALGVRTSLKVLVDVGPAPVAAMVLQTLFLAAFVLVGLKVLG